MHVYLWSELWVLGPKIKEYSRLKRGSFCVLLTEGESQARHLSVLKCLFPLVVCKIMYVDEYSLK